MGECNETDGQEKQTNERVLYTQPSLSLFFLLPLSIFLLFLHPPPLPFTLHLSPPDRATTSPRHSLYHYAKTRVRWMTSFACAYVNPSVCIRVSVCVNLRACVCVWTKTRPHHNTDHITQHRATPHHARLSISPPVSAPIHPSPGRLLDHQQRRGDGPLR